MQVLGIRKLMYVHYFIPCLAGVSELLKLIRMCKEAYGILTFSPIAGNLKASGAGSLSLNTVLVTE